MFTCGFNTIGGETDTPPLIRSGIQGERWPALLLTLNVPQTY